MLHQGSGTSVRGTKRKGTIDDDAGNNVLHTAKRPRRNTKRLRYTDDLPSHQRRQLKQVEEEDLLRHEVVDEGDVRSWNKDTVIDDREIYQECTIENEPYESASVLLRGSFVANSHRQRPITMEQLFPELQAITHAYQLRAPVPVAWTEVDERYKAARESGKRIKISEGDDDDNSCGSSEAAYDPFETANLLKERLKVPTKTGLIRTLGMDPSFEISTVVFRNDASERSPIVLSDSDDEDNVASARVRPRLGTPPFRSREDELRERREICYMKLHVLRQREIQERKRAREDIIEISDSDSDSDLGSHDASEPAITPAPIRDTPATEQATPPPQNDPNMQFAPVELEANPASITASRSEKQVQARPHARIDTESKEYQHTPSDCGEQALEGSSHLREELQEQSCSAFSMASLIDLMEFEEWPSVRSTNSDVLGEEESRESDESVQSDESAMVQKRMLMMPSLATLDHTIDAQYKSFNGVAQWIAIAREVSTCTLAGTDPVESGSLALEELDLAPIMEAETLPASPPSMILELLNATQPTLTSTRPIFETLSIPVYEDASLEMPPSTPEELAHLERLAAEYQERENARLCEQNSQGGISREACIADPESVQLREEAETKRRQSTTGKHPADKQTSSHTSAQPSERTSATRGFADFHYSRVRRKM